MKSGYKRKLFTRPVVIAFFITLTSLLFLPPAKGSEDGSTAAPSIEENRFVKSTSGTIELKSKNRIVVMERSYSVAEETIILNERGKRIQLFQLPCLLSRQPWESRS